VRSVDDMLSGARVEVAAYKDDPLDFVLWKPSTPEQPGWDGPVVDGAQVGRGRPGWHIECSAMSHELLGAEFDIHGGGNDLLFPHHENEIAQSRCAHPGSGFARVWMHNEMLQVEGKKMSKSLGNFFTVRDLLDQGVPGEVIRFVMLSTHYRKPMDWTEKATSSAKSFLSTLYADGIVGMLEVVDSGKLVGNLPSPDPEIVGALADDLNTHLALKIFREKSKTRNTNLRRDALQTISDGLLLGFFSGGGKPQQTIAQNLTIDSQELVAWIIERRNRARNERDFGLADALREGLELAGVHIEDGPEGSIPMYGPEFDPSKLEALK